MLFSDYVLSFNLDNGIFLKIFYFINIIYCAFVIGQGMM